MDLSKLVAEWFDRWQTGDFLNLPVTENFTHTSPFGTIRGKQAYISLVKANRQKFLGYRFDIHDTIIDQDRACVRYTATQGDFGLDVSEWYYGKDNLIDKIIAYYHIGEIREDRELSRQ